MNLDDFKYEIAGELVPHLRSQGDTKIPLTGTQVPWSTSDYDQLKFEIAQELGVPLQPGYNGDLTARDAGRIGGKIGGSMVRRMIALAEQALANKN